MITPVLNQKSSQPPVLRDLSSNDLSTCMDAWVATRPGDYIYYPKLQYRLDSDKTELLVTKVTDYYLKVTNGIDVIDIPLSELSPYSSDILLKDTVAAARNRTLVRENLEQDCASWVKDPNWLPIPSKSELSVIRKVIRKLEKLNTISFGDIYGAVDHSCQSSSLLRQKSKLITKLVFDHLTGRFMVPMHSMIYSSGEWRSMARWCEHSPESVNAVQEAFLLGQELKARFKSQHQQLFSYKKQKIESSSQRITSHSVLMKEALSSHAHHFDDRFGVPEVRTMERLRLVQLELRDRKEKVLQALITLSDAGIFRRETPAQALLDRSRHSPLRYYIMPILRTIYGINFDTRSSKYKQFSVDDVLYGRCTIRLFLARRAEVAELEANDMDCAIRNWVSDLTKLSDTLDAVKSHHIPSINRALSKKHGFKFRVDLENSTDYLKGISCYHARISCPSRGYSSPKFSDPGLLVLVLKNYVTALADILIERCRSPERVSYDQFHSLEHNAACQVRSLLETIS